MSFVINKKKLNEFIKLKLKHNNKHLAVKKKFFIETKRQKLNFIKLYQLY